MQKRSKILALIFVALFFVVYSQVKPTEQIVEPEETAIVFGATDTIGYDATTEGPEPTRGASSETYAHTNGASANYMTVTILRNDDTTTAADDVTGVTYNGVSMTQLGKYNTSTQEPGVLYIYGLANPATGSNNVVISLTGSTGSRAYSVTNSYTGVAATGQPDASNTGTTVGTSLTVSVTTVDDNAWLIGAMGVNSGGVTQSAGTGTVLRGAVTTGDNLGSYDANSPTSPAGSDSLVMNSSASRTMYGLVLSLAAEGAVAGGGDTGAPVLLPKF